ncbi:Myb/SANT-like DNA-binding domain-containing protein [Lactarius quietus]|nr:Myb/SANT-like DNA-binding domain-containing protein [Lactarius quietus]
MPKKEKDKENKNKKSITKWSQRNEALLVHTLADQKAKGEWGDNNPKKAAWVACVAALAGSEKESGGHPKTETAVKSRWQRLKQEFDTVKKLRGLSGFGWDDIEQKVTASDDVWEDYLKVKEHHDHQKFQHKKFPLFDEIADLVDGTRAMGTNAFRAGQTSLYEPPSYDDPSLDPALRDISLNVARATDATNTLHRTIKKPGDSFYNSDIPSSSEDEGITAPKPPTLKRKRARSIEPVPDEYIKPCRISAGQGMQKMANSMELVARAMNPSLPSPHQVKGSPAADPQAEAIAYIERQGGLSEKEFAEAFELFVSDPGFAKAYIGLRTDDARTNVLHNRLVKLGVNVD